MIVSFARGFVFVAIPKTATHAFRVALRPHLGRADWEQCYLFEKKAFPVEPLARRRHGHLTCEEVRPFLIAGLWDRFYKFCTVRNPYDRFVSHVYFRLRHDSALTRDALGVLKKTLTEADSRGWAAPQAHYITDADGQVMVDHVARYEDLQAHFDVICRRIGVPESTLPIVNAAHPPPWETSYDSELRDMVRDRYADDFRLFGYPTELP